MSKSLRLAALATLAMLPATASFAAGQAPGGHEPVTGMPQLAFGHPEQGAYLVGQVVWLLVIFGVLYFLMAKVALPRMAGVLEVRRNRIEGDLEAARVAKQSADAAMTEHRTATARARAEAQASIAAAVTQAQDELATKTDAMNAKLAKQIEAAERQISAARDQALGALRQVSADTAEAVVARIAGGANRGAIDAAVDRELAARGHA
jgi:F-type H+-transporting ATPase subunit b